MTEWIIGFIIVGVVAVMGISVVAHNDAREAFMAECVKDHKDYECTAMWRAGEPSVVPVFIPIR